MTRDELQKLAADFSDQSPYNYLGMDGESMSSDEAARNNYAKNNLMNAGHSPEMFDIDDFGEFAGMRFFEQPIFSACQAGDPLFRDIKRPEVVGAHHTLPEDWLPEAKTVLSFFLPYSHPIVEANRKDPVVPPIEWLYTRVDGQKFLLALGAEMCKVLIADNHKAVVPYTDDKFVMRVGGPATPGTEHIPQFSSNWSERHVAYVAGLGTFGLSTNFISKLGSAGRLISVVTDWDVEPDIRDYDNWLGYCNHCEACIRRCPPKAHYKDKVGKDHEKCSMFIGEICKPFTPRYGCGKCQSGIPCEYQPMKAK